MEVLHTAIPNKLAIKLKNKRPPRFSQLLRNYNMRIWRTKMLHLKKNKKSYYKSLPRKSRSNQNNKQIRWLELTVKLRCRKKLRRTRRSECNGASKPIPQILKAKVKKESSKLIIHQNVCRVNHPKIHYLPECVNISLIKRSHLSQQNRTFKLLKKDNKDLQGVVTRHLNKEKRSMMI